MFWNDKALDRDMRILDLIDAQNFLIRDLRKRIDMLERSALVGALASATDAVNRSYAAARADASKADL